MNVFTIPTPGLLHPKRSHTTPAQQTARTHTHPHAELVRCHDRTTYTKITVKQCRIKIHKYVAQNVFIYYLSANLKKQVSSEITYRQACYQHRSNVVSTNRTLTGSSSSE